MNCDRDCGSCCWLAFCWCLWGPQAQGAPPAEPTP